MIELDWRPSAEIGLLLERAKVIGEIRQFFLDRGLLEVETPILSEFAVTDLHLNMFETQYKAPFEAKAKTLYLRTSPEFHMKRLLAGGSGAIFQIGKVFRNEEAGRLHNPEFSMLEWYRPYFEMHRLINEVDDLLQQILDCEAADYYTYQFVFQEYTDLDPLECETDKLATKAQKHGLQGAENIDRDSLLQYLFGELIEPNIGKARPAVVYNFPASQAALAKISPEDHRVAERFEFYYQGFELANGYNELTDAEEQRQRFEQDNTLRLERGLPEQPIDDRLLLAIDEMPECSGVALGLDRLLMLALHRDKDIRDVISFSIDVA